MGKAFDPPVPDNLVEWIRQQRIFFVSTAPRSVKGRVNLSPKSGNQFRVVNDGRSVCYLDFTGSGSETSAHLMDSDGRITIMLVQLEEGSPRICRLFGKGKIIVKSDIPPDVLDLFDERDVNDFGFRWIIWVDLTRISTSCGYSVPIYQYVKERNTLREVTEKLGEQGMEAYRAKKNFVSIDNLFCQPPEKDVSIPTRVQVEDGFPLCYYDEGDSNTPGGRSVFGWLPSSQTKVYLSIRRWVFRCRLQFLPTAITSEAIWVYALGCATGSFAVILLGVSPRFSRDLPLL